MLPEFGKEAAEAVGSLPLSSESSPAPSSIVTNPQPNAARGFGQVSGLNPAIALYGEAKQEACMERHSRRPYYEKAEILAALRDLSEDEIKQMLKRAAFQLMGSITRFGYVDVEDLFMDAVIRTMEQKRRWARSVSASNHFFGVMKSIGHQRLKQAGRHTPLNELVAAPQNWSLSALDAQASVTRLKKELQDDAIALKVLESMMVELRPRHARRFLGISVKVYWAARKRIRRSAENLPGAALHRSRL